MLFNDFSRLWICDACAFYIGAIDQVKNLRLLFFCGHRWRVILSFKLLLFNHLGWLVTLQGYCLFTWLWSLNHVDYWSMTVKNVLDCSLVVDIDWKCLCFASTFLLHHVFFNCLCLFPVQSSYLSLMVLGYSFILLFQSPRC